MANLSDRTRKNQVYIYLYERMGVWVDGPNISNEKVGGSEGIRRVRELRSDGFRIEQRRHPNPERDTWQYRMVLAPTVSPLREQPRRQTSSLKEAVHFEQAGIDGGYHYIEPEPKLATADEEPAVADFSDGHKYTTDPGRLEIGMSVPCPRCHLRGTLSPKTHFPCTRCNGWGVVPVYKATLTPDPPNTGRSAHAPE